MLDHTLKPDVATGRLEVITETGRRRWFSKDDKAGLSMRRWRQARSFPMLPVDMG